MSKAGNEHALRKSVSEWLAAEQRGRRLWYIKLSGSRYQRVGAPDYLICVEGKFLAIELKNVGEEMSPAQQREREAIVLGGKGVHWMLTSLDSVKDAVQALRTKVLVDRSIV
jgi:hypothetical protein